MSFMLESLELDINLNHVITIILMFPSLLEFVVSM